MRASIVVRLRDPEAVHLHALPRELGSDALKELGEVGLRLARRGAAVARIRRAIAVRARVEPRRACDRHELGHVAGELRALLEPGDAHHQFTAPDALVGGGALGQLGERGTVAGIIFERHTAERFSVARVLAEAPAQRRVRAVQPGLRMH